MAKLHELLAVESSLKGQATETVKGILDLFEKKERHFSAIDSTFHPLSETGISEQVEILEMQTTVQKELAWLAEFLIRKADVMYQVDVGNQTAVADIVMEDGTLIVESVPSSTLLEMEKEIREFQNVIKHTKTLDPTKGFTPDPTHAFFNVYAAREVTNHRTAKIQEPLTLAPATDKHPAQVQMITRDVVVGDVKKKEWSGLMTPSDKAQLLDRCENLIRAIRKARSRANEVQVDVTTTKIGHKLYTYLGVA